MICHHPLVPQITNGLIKEEEGEKEEEEEEEKEQEEEEEGEEEDFVCLVGFLTSSSTTRLYRGRAPRQSVLQFYVLPHMRQSWETMTSVSAGHIILTPTQPVRSGVYFSRKHSKTLENTRKHSKTLENTRKHSKTLENTSYFPTGYSPKY